MATKTAKKPTKGLAKALRVKDTDTSFLMLQTVMAKLEGWQARKELFELEFRNLNAEATKLVGQLGDQVGIKADDLVKYNFNPAERVFTLKEAPQ